MTNLPLAVRRTNTDIHRLAKNLEAHLHFKNQRWEFIHENKKVKKKENPLSTKKAAKKKEKRKKTRSRTRKKDLKKTGN